MAKGSKRQRKKQQKQTLQSQVRSFTGYSEREVKNLSFSSLLSIAEEERKKEERNRKRRERYAEKKKEEERKERRRKQQKEYRQNARRKKTAYIESFGFSRDRFKATEIDSIKVEDMNRGNLPLFFDRVFHFGNKGLYFAFRDYSGEHSFEEILSMFTGLSDKQLLQQLQRIAKEKPTYSKGSKRSGGGSSGRAGDYKFLSDSDEVIRAFAQDTEKENNKPTTREWKSHKGMYKGFQELSSGGDVVIKESTPRHLLIVANALMYNVTELERGLFYRRFYSEICSLIPMFRDILPKP